MELVMESYNRIVQQLLFQNALLVIFVWLHVYFRTNPLVKGCQLSNNWDLSCNIIEQHSFIAWHAYLNNGGHVEQNCLDRFPLFLFETTIDSTIAVFYPGSEAWV